MGFWRKDKQDPDEIYAWAEECYRAGDYEQAVSCFETAAIYGVEDAMCRLGYCYAHGKGVKQDYAVALHWFYEAAELDCADALYQLGRMHEDGVGVTRNPISAVEYYRKAARLGSVDAALMLGNCYAAGNGVDIDYDRAIDCWSWAAEHGSEQAEHNIQWTTYVQNEELEAAICMIYGTEGMEQDIPFGLEIVDKGIELGDSAAVYFMGKLLLAGLPGYVEQDAPQGLAYIYRAALEGEGGAMFDFISIWKQQSFEGVSVKLDDASFGQRIVAIAEKNLGSEEKCMDWVYAYAAWAYLNGYGVEKNPTLAKQWIDPLPPHMRNSPYIKTLLQL